MIRKRKKYSGVIRMCIGSDGIVPSAGNFSPSIYIQMYNSVLAQDKEKGEKIYTISMEISKIFQKNKSLGQSIAALKVMLNEINLCSTTMIPPLTELAEEEVSRIRIKTHHILNNIFNNKL